MPRCVTGCCGVCSPAVVCRICPLPGHWLVYPIHQRPADPRNHIRQTGTPTDTRPTKITRHGSIAPSVSLGAASMKEAVLLFRLVTCSITQRLIISCDGSASGFPPSKLSASRNQDLTTGGSHNRHRPHPAD